ncbi:MAG: NAD(P)H-dependent oxidoreductase [Propionibacteriaceae bacterium]|jgi:NAD(P)H dehydrogenase (quinone)|nr:NAD(P)H-dependent oxidoreductase [Propionibacteriaceae bacterium]
MSRVLVVWAHPKAESFTAVVAAEVLRAAAKVGAVVEESDLYRNGFDPRYSLADFERFNAGGKGVATPDVLEEQAKLAAADGIAFVFPVWWWSVPAYLKGYIERVITRGFAYGHSDTGEAIKQLAGKKIRLIALTASPDDTYESEGFVTAMQTQLVHGIFELYCRVTDVKLEYFYHVTGTRPGDDASQALLERAAAIGAELAI